MKVIIVETPHPYCILNLSDPARAYIPADHTDVAKTWEQHTETDYQREIERIEYLEDR